MNQTTYHRLFTSHGTFHSPFVMASVNGLSYSLILVKQGLVASSVDRKDSTRDKASDFQTATSRFSIQMITSLMISIQQQLGC